MQSAMTAATIAARFANKFPHLVRVGSTPRTPGSALQTVRSGLGLLTGYESSLDREDPDKWTRDGYVELFRQDYTQTSTLRPLKTILRESCLHTTRGCVPDSGHLTPENTPKLAALAAARAAERFLSSGKNSYGSSSSESSQGGSPPGSRGSSKAFERRFKRKGYSAIGHWFLKLLRRFER